MHTPKKARKQVRVYLDSPEAEILAAAMKALPKLNESDLMSWVMSAGLEALREVDYRFQMPLAFTVGSHEKRCAEPPGRLRK